MRDELPPLLPQEEVMGYVPLPPPRPNRMVARVLTPELPHPTADHVLPNAPPLDPHARETFDAWCEAPAHDARTLDEFAADGGHYLPNVYGSMRAFGVRPSYEPEPRPPVRPPRTGGTATVEWRPTPFPEPESIR